MRLLTEVSFKKIKESAEIRQSKVNVNEKLNEICDNIPKEFQKDVHGTHRWCYKNFTNTTFILKRKNDSDQVIPKDGNPQRSSHHFFLKMNVCSVKVVAKEHMEEKKNLLNV